MKKLSKIMLSVAAAFVVTAAMAVTAMADDTIIGTYDNDTGVVTMNGVVGSGKSQTLLVLNNVTEVENSSDIAYINQIDNNGTFSTFTLEAGLKPATASESVKFNIKIGGTDGTVQTGTLTIAGDAPATVTIIIGDVSGDGKLVNATDLLYLGRYVKKTQGLTTGEAGVEKFKVDGTKVIVGDVSGDGKLVNATDLLYLGRYVKKTQGLTTGQAGEKVDVVKVDVSDESAE